MGFARSRLFQQLVTAARDTATGPWDLTILALHAMILESGFHCNAPLTNRLPKGDVSMVVLPRGWRTSAGDGSMQYCLEYVLAADARLRLPCDDDEGDFENSDSKDDYKLDSNDDSSCGRSSNIILRLSSGHVAAQTPLPPENLWHPTGGDAPCGSTSNSDYHATSRPDTRAAVVPSAPEVQSRNARRPSIVATLLAFLADSADKAVPKSVVEFEIPEELRTIADSSKATLAPTVAPHLVLLVAQNVVKALCQCEVAVPVSMWKRCKLVRRRSEISMDEVSGSDVHDPERPGQSSGSSKCSADQPREAVASGSSSSSSSIRTPAANRLLSLQRRDPQPLRIEVPAPEFEPNFGMRHPDIDPLGNVVFQPQRNAVPHGFAPEGNLIGPTNPGFGLCRPAPLGGPRYDPPGPFGRLDVNPDHEPVPRFRLSGHPQNPLDTMFM